MGLFTETVRRGFTDDKRKKDKIHYKELIGAIIDEQNNSQKIDIGELLGKWGKGRIEDIKKLSNELFAISDECDEKPILSQEQLLLLKVCLALPFKLGAYKSLEDVLTELRVTVIIEPGVKKRIAPLKLYEEKSYWEEQAKRTDLDSTSLKDAKKMLEETQNKINSWESTPLRGEYLYPEKIIKLYPEEMKTEYKGKKMNELLVSTLVHETMHAYFDRPLHEHLPYYASIEEPMAEFGMLVFLHENKISRI